MSKVIIFNTADGKTLVAHPATDLPIHSVAKLTVPYGMHYKLVESEELPDMQFYEAWEWDGSDADGVGTALVETEGEVTYD
jgi:hypothetical protein